MKISNRVSIRGGEQRCTFRIVSNSMERRWRQVEHGSAASKKSNRREEINRKSPLIDHSSRLVTPRADGIAFSGKPQRRGFGGAT